MTITVTNIISPPPNHILSPVSSTSPNKNLQNVYPQLCYTEQRRNRLGLKLLQHFCPSQGEELFGLFEQLNQVRRVFIQQWPSFSKGQAKTKGFDEVSDQDGLLKRAKSGQRGKEENKNRNGRGLDSSRRTLKIIIMEGVNREKRGLAGGKSAGGGKYQIGK